MEQATPSFIRRLRTIDEGEFNRGYVYSRPIYTPFRLGRPGSGADAWNS